MLFYSMPFNLNVIKALPSILHRFFLKQKKRKYIFVDAPGHKVFIKNMITGASSADIIAILIIDVHEGIKEQTKKHTYH